MDREHILHCIGNLTLVSGKLNPTLSNAAWHDSAKGTRGKLTSLSEHSQLRLNDQLVKKYGDGWNENTIKKRGLELFKAACFIWPDPAVLTGPRNTMDNSV